MFRFENPEYLYLLAIVPLLFLVRLLMQRRRKNNLKKLGDPELLKRLMPDVSAHRRGAKFWLMQAALALLIVMMARPQMGTKINNEKRQGIEVMIALDVSNSMLARDYSPCRLERAKLAISRLVDKLDGDRIGLVLFAGTSFVQLPITTDYVSAIMFLGSISTGSVPVQSMANGEAVNTCIRSFSAQIERSRAIIVITDGENHEDDPVEAAKQAAEMGIRVFTIGVGSPEGQPIPVAGGLLKDSNGEIVVTRLDENVLKDVARAGGGAYVRAGNEEFGLNPIISEIKNMDQEEFNSIVFEEYDEQYMYFFAIALVLLTIQMLVGERKVLKNLFDR